MRVIMDTKTLISESKARFAHNAAKAYLKEKYTTKLIVAEQGGLWSADLSTISFLQSSTQDDVVMIDTFQNPVKVSRLELLTVLETTYNKVMNEWHDEWKQLESKR